MKRGLIDKEGKANVGRAVFSKARRDLIAAGRIACINDFVWMVR